MHSIWPEFTGSCAQLAGTCGLRSPALCASWLLVKQNIWNWLIGITNNIFNIIIFYNSGFSRTTKIASILHRIQVSPLDAIHYPDLVPLDLPPESRSRGLLRVRGVRDMLPHSS